MQSVASFAFDDSLVRGLVRDGDPWFVGRDVCECLGIAKHLQALDVLEADERGTCIVGTPGGDQTVIIISEPGVYRLVFRSRKPEAERFKRWLAHDVLPQLRRAGAFDASAACEPVASLDPAREPLLHRLQIVREARAIHGRAVAAMLWRKLGLPAVPPPPPTALDEARQLLRHILDAPDLVGGRRVRDLLALAFDDDEEARLRLLATGIRVYPERETFVVANGHPWLAALLRGGEWAAPGAVPRILRRLPETRAAGPVNMGPLKPRGTELPSSTLDD